MGSRGHPFLIGLTGFLFFGFPLLYGIQHHKAAGDVAG